MNKPICPLKECTACNLCANICPKSCISIYSDNTELYAVKDENICISCGLCEKVCPSLQKPKGNEPQKAFAAWSNDKETHRQSASGGIATEIYRYALSKGWSTVGVIFNDSFEAVYKVTTDIKDIFFFKNSKYVYSNPFDVYTQVRKLCKNGKKVVFVGLPCHVAAMLTMAEEFKFRNQLFLIDLACHGTPSPVLFQDHFNALQAQLKEKVTKVYFRDPSFGTQNFFFSLYHEDKLLLRSKVSEDLYCYGYHHGLIYRECCYQCKYAKRTRFGDLTLSDYRGLGTVSLYNDNRTKVSCILVNTQRGENWLASMNTLILHHRPIDEPIIHERVFNFPYKRKPEVDEFKISYAKTKDFDGSIRPLVARLSIMEKKTARNPKIILRKIAEYIIPYHLKFYIKYLIKK